MSSSLTTFEAGELDEWRNFCFDIPGLPPKAKCFLRRELDLVGMEVSLNCLGPFEDMPFVHRHRNNEEVYVFVRGVGEFQADGRILPVQAGTCIRCAPGVARTWRNTGTDDLLFLVIQAPMQSIGTATVDDGEVTDDKPLWAQ